MAQTQNQNQNSTQDRNSKQKRSSDREASSSGGQNESAIAQASLGDIANEMSERVSDRLSQAKKSLRSSRESLRDADMRLRQQLERRPLIVLGSALGLGYLVGSRVFGLVPRVLMLIGAKTVFTELSKQGVFEKLNLRASR
jgi:hypothetical protein